MRLFFIDWFGWSFLWILPLLGKVVISLISGKGLLGRGSIRLWLGTLLVMCASSTIEAMLRTQGNTVVESALLGQSLATHLIASVGKLFTVLSMLGCSALGLFWLFGRNKKTADDAAIAADNALSGAAPPRSVRSAPSTMSTPISGNGINMSNANSGGIISGAGGAGIATPDTPVRKRDPFPLPNELLNPTRQNKVAGSRWPLTPKNQEENKRPARPASEWAPFETLRPTEAMLARSAAQTASQARQPEQRTSSTIVSRATQDTPQRPKPSPFGSATKVRVSTASDRSQSIPTSLSASLQTKSATTATAAVLPAIPAIPPAPVITSPRTPTELNAHVPAPMPQAQPAPVSTPATPATPATPSTQFNTTASSIPPAAADHFPDASEAVVAPASSWTTPFSTQPAKAPEPVITPQPAESAAPSEPSEPSEQLSMRTWVPTQVNIVQTAAPAPVTQPVAPPVAPPAYRFDSVPLPGIDLLDQGSDAPVEMDEAQLHEIGQLIEQRLKEFKVPVTVLGAYAGPVITRFEIEPALGVRGAQIVNLMKDLARALGLTSIRVVETIPGKTCMGLELPNPKRQMIRLAEIIQSEAYARSASHLTLAMGKDITGIPVATDLARAPHMLVAGTTGSGKSVAINAMILSLLYKATPDEVRLIMIDPKMLELSVYDGIPHLLAPVVTDMKLAAHALSWCVAEMDKRYRLMSALGVRNLAGYNQKIDDGIAAEKYVKNPFSLTPDAPEPLERLPMIVVVIDELADLMMVAGKKIEELIARLAQKARAAGIHLILATQRPSVDVITGLIKANIPTRVAFQVSSKIDSRTVLDQMGAETLLGHGDMLFLPPGSGYPQRVHGAFVSDEEVHRVVEHLKEHGEPQYEEAILAGPASEEQPQGEIFGEGGDEADALYDDAVAYVTRSRRASISSVQRQFRIGYNRAARLVEQMEAAGILSSMSKSGARDVLAPPPPDL